MKLTPKQEAFCLAYMENGNASKAYRKTYKADAMKPESVNRLAFALLQNVKITSRLEELREIAAKRHEVTVDSLLAELDEARELARELAKPEAMVSATMGKAKICGHDKKILQHQNPDGTPVVPVTRVEIVAGGNSPH